MRIIVIAITLITLIAVVVVSILYGTDLFIPGIKPTPTPTPTPTVALTPTPMPTPTSPPTQEPPSRDLTVHFIDVGQGDAILIDLGDTEVLIDGGGRSPGITAYLEDYVNGSLEVMVATHPHADHIGGLIEVLDDFDVDEIWLNGDAYTSKTYSDFMTRVNAEGAEIEEARIGETIVVGNLFESSMIASSVIYDIDILKIAHHGSRRSHFPLFLSIVKPEVAIYMASEDNTYGHPHPETIQALEDIGAEVYGTDVCGTITVVTDGSEYTVLGCTP